MTCKCGAAGKLLALAIRVIAFMQSDVKLQRGVAQSEIHLRNTVVWILRVSLPMYGRSQAYIQVNHSSKRGPVHFHVWWRAGVWCPLLPCFHSRLTWGCPFSFSLRQSLIYAARKESRTSVRGVLWGQPPPLPTPHCFDIPMSCGYQFQRVPDLGGDLGNQPRRSNSWNPSPFCMTGQSFGP